MLNKIQTSKKTANRYTRHVIKSSLKKARK